MAEGAERDRPGGWRKQSPQLSVEEGGDGAGAGESSAFKAVPPWRTRTPPGLAQSLPGQTLAAPPSAAWGLQSASRSAGGTGGLQAQQEVVQGLAPGPLGVHPLRSCGPHPSFGVPELRTPGKGRESGLPRWQRQSGPARGLRAGLARTLGAGEGGGLASARP